MSRNDFGRSKDTCPDQSSALLHTADGAMGLLAKSLIAVAINPKGPETMAMSMARFWRDEGKRQQAHDLLPPVYGWFTEGLDTLDLKEAKALLNELAT
jgi:hypothetical protein